MSAPSFHPGFRVGRYELLAPIARGGMASVWAARMRGAGGFQKLVAVKTIPPHLADDPRFESMFLDEARIAADIVHPNVAQVFDLGEEDGVLFMVFEWIDGDPLSILIRAVTDKGDRIPVPIALRIMADVCGGLHAAHELCDSTGQPLLVVHRDVSPQNVVVSDAGAVKVIDFGVAKALNRAGAETVSGRLKGKVQYMAPEQAMSVPVDRRADVYGAGAVLHHMLSGAFPLPASSPVEALNMLLSRVSPRPLPVDIPESVAAIVTRAMAYDREARFQSAADMQVELVMALREISKPVTNADVAAFVRRYLSAQSAQRHRMVTAAIEAVQTHANADPNMTLVDYVTGFEVPEEEEAPMPLVRRSGHDWSDTEVRKGMDELQSLVKKTMPIESVRPPPMEPARESIPELPVRKPRWSWAIAVAALAGLLTLGVVLVQATRPEREAAEPPRKALGPVGALPVTATVEVSTAASSKATNAPSATSSAPATKSEPHHPVSRPASTTTFPMPPPGWESLPSITLDPNVPEEDQPSHIVVPPAGSST